MTDGEAKAIYGPLDEEGSMTKDYWPEGLVDEVSPDTLGAPDKWLHVLLGDNAVASDVEVDEDDYAAVRGRYKVGDTVCFDVCTNHAPISVTVNADGYDIVGAVPEGANWFAVADEWEYMQATLDALIEAERKHVNVSPTLTVDVCTWAEEHWQIVSATEIVQVQAPTEEATA
jgi:hypothetical protein